MRTLSFLIAKRLGKLALDVLSNHLDSAGNSHIPLGANRSWIDQLLEQEANWTPFGTISVATPLSLSPGPAGLYPAQTITIQEQSGVRAGEIKIVQQREHPIRAWSEPVRAIRPAHGVAFVFLLRDNEGEFHARYLPDLNNVPDALRLRIIDGTRGSDQTALSFEDGVVLEDELLGRILAALRLSHNVILYGPPGTGKTYLMQKVQQAFSKGLRNVLFDADDLREPFKSQDAQPITTRGTRSTEFVTFHASAAYETFMVGLRPEIDPATHALRYVVQPGPLLELAAAAAQDDSAALMLIDEINRGNTAEVFGELITVLEPDKRLRPDNSVDPEFTIEVRLPYAPPPPGSHGAAIPSIGRPAVGPPVVESGRFRMPWHLYMLGSMNSVDRTVAPLDSALRRRFQVIEVAPDLARLRVQAQKVADTLPEAEQEGFLVVARLAHDALAALNETIAVKRGPDFRLGHSYLWPVVSEARRDLATRTALLVAAFGDALLPQLRELLRDRPEDLRDVLGGDANEGRLFRFHANPITGLAETGGWLEMLPYPSHLTNDDALQVIRIIAARAGNNAWSASPSDELVSSDDDLAEPVPESP